MFSQKSFPLRNKVEKYGRENQAKNDNVIQHMHILCRITKATNRLSECILIFVFYCKDSYTNAPHCYPCTYFAPCLYINYQLDALIIIYS